MPFKRLIEGGLNLYEEVHPKNVREAINILDRFFLYQRSFDDTASEAWKLIRANLKEARMMNIRFLRTLKILVSSILLI